MKLDNGSAKARAGLFWCKERIGDEKALYNWLDLSTVNRYLAMIKDLMEYGYDIRKDEDGLLL